MLMQGCGSFQFPHSVASGSERHVEMTRSDVVGIYDWPGGRRESYEAVQKG
jgi:hypothetical protein